MRAKEAGRAAGPGMSSSLARAASSRHPRSMSRVQAWTLLMALGLGSCGGDGASTPGGSAGTAGAAGSAGTLETCGGSPRPVSDGCNTCWCESGHWACTLIGCLNEGECVSSEACATQDYCSFASCLAATGRCVPRTTTCSTELSPSCGCDGVTYDTECARLAAGQSKLSDGACPTTDTCEVGGVTYGEGQPGEGVFLGEDGCSVCQCLHGVVLCDASDCGP